MRTNNRTTHRHLIAAMLTVVMMMALAIPAFAAEVPADPPDLETIADLYVNWDGSYELPDLSELSEDDLEIVKAMVDAAMQAREAENQAQAETQDETQDDTEVPLTASFSDVPTTNNFYDAIMWCAGKGIVGGYKDGTFKPTNPVTRAQFCVMLSRAFYPNEVKKYDTDAYKAVWFGPNTKALSVAGVLKNTSFQYAYGDAKTMDQYISRYDMAQLMTNIMSNKGFNATTAQKNAAQAKITDYKSIPSKYQNAVKTVYALGIIGGYGDGSFKGTVTMNRGQGAVVIYRMAKYTPAASTGKPTTDDAGKPTTTPSTGTSTGNTGNTGTSTGNTGSTSTGTSTGNTGTTNTTGKLANGKAITEANVLAIIQELRGKYPNGMTWGDNTSRTGMASAAMNQISNNYVGTNGFRVSMQAGCGGFASLVSDTIFGSGNANPARKVPLEQVRPGDVVVYMKKDGKTMHFAIAASRINDTYDISGYVYPTTGMYDGNNGGKIIYTDYKPIYPKNNPYYTTGDYMEVWTRYPDNNTTPWTGGSTSGNTGDNTGSNTGTTTPSTGSNTGTTSTDWATWSKNKTCDLCGGVTPTWTLSADRSRHVCENCAKTTAGKNYIG